MKKIVLVLSSLLITIGLCSCGNGGGDLFSKPTPTPIPQVNPINVLSAENVYEGVDYAYAPVLEGDNYTQDGNTATAYYRSNPIGQGDPVEIKITQFSETVPKENVWYEYDASRVSRPSAEMVEGLGEDAFIAFPSIHIYDRGCHIQITAGSGADDTQKNTLLKLAQIAVTNFENIMPADTSDAQAQTNAQ